MVYLWIAKALKYQINTVIAKQYESSWEVPGKAVFLKDRQYKVKYPHIVDNHGTVT